MTMMFLNYWWCFTIICHTNWLWGKLHHVSCTFTVCFSRLVWMLSSCNCFCLFSLDSRSWWTCSSFTFCRTRPDSPTVQSSSAQLISLCLGLPGSESRKNPFSVCLHYKTLWRKYFLPSENFWEAELADCEFASMRERASWPVLFLLHRSRIRQFLEAWESVTGVKKLAAHTVWNKEVVQAC